MELKAMENFRDSREQELPYQGYEYMLSWNPYFVHVHIA